jgi:hypothetical protein
MGWRTSRSRRRSWNGPGEHVNELDLVDLLLKLRGYTKIETQEGEVLVVRIYRPDGSLAITARRPPPELDR